METVNVRATLVELYSRKTPEAKENNKDIYWNGDNNLYPNEIQGVVYNSPTAKRAASVLSKYISGQGVVNESGELIEHKALPVVNTKKGYKITDIIRMSGDDLSVQSGVWFHRTISVSEAMLFTAKSIDVLPYVKCRKGKDDDEGNSGKIYFKDYEEKAKRGGKKKETTWFYPFSDSQAVIRAQILADAGKEQTDEVTPEDVKSFRGQVFYLNTTPQFHYALSRFDPVYNDMDTEYRIGLYLNSQSRTGFLGKTIFITQGLDEEKSKQIQEDLASFMGAEDSGSMYHLDVSHADDITKVLHTIQLKAQLEPELFEKVRRSLRLNILGQAENLPEPLVYASEGALFGTSSDTYSEMKKFFSEQVRPTQDLLEQTLTMLGFPCKIRPIVEEQVAEVSDKQADAQAALKGSVGGVTALIQLQQSVSQGFTTRDAAIAIIENIYGIDAETASKMIGNPIETPPTDVSGEQQQNIG